VTRERRFPADPTSVTAARRFATDALVDDAVDVCQAVELMVSELATNCVRHAHTGFRLAITQTDQEIRVEVTDDGDGSPRMQSPRPDEPSGRGLRIVDMLSKQWGITRDASPGKTVWFTVASSPVLEPASRSS
jgi:anti-sigma regulatory factor (Ser/Thr protein kinase)